MNIIEEIARVIDIETEALQSVRDNLNSQFEEAVRTIAGCRGQILVSGIGKSGIIGQKIAATFRSTGTPALFLHAVEALHGDVGVVRADDVVLAVGKSGESGELNALLRVLKKIGLPIISMTSNPTSAMASMSDVVLHLEIPREACPLNLAPTASTTAALAVGDALAVTLMKMNDVSREDFARHHPGGQLGRRLLLTVDDVMRKGEQNPTIGSDQSVREMIVAITAFQVGAISVVDPEQKFLGLVTDYDIRKALEGSVRIESMSIRDIMNPTPETILSHFNAAETLEHMKARGKPTAVMPVLDPQGIVVGMVHLHDLVAAGV
jgi:arabinose-5-phosphate isomerase